MPASVRALLTGLIDYAGLFPPAQLPMPAAVYNYQHYLAAPYPWILGRFIVPAARLEEFEREARPYLPPTCPDPHWRLSLLSSDPVRDVERLQEFNHKYGSGPEPVTLIDSIEIKTDSTFGLDPVKGVFPPDIQVYWEIPLGGETAASLATISRLGFNAKIRCGGFSNEHFPSAAQLARFLEECSTAGVSFKATAGLHHPLRGSYPVTEEPDSLKAEMHGFLNLFLCAAWVRKGMSGTDAAELLEEKPHAAFRFLEDGVAWRNHYIGADEIAAARREFALAFGSCSFAEPVSDLRKLSLI